MDTKHGVYVQMKLLTFRGSGLLNERKYVGKYVSVCEPAWKKDISPIKIQTAAGDQKHRLNSNALKSH